MKKKMRIMALAIVTMVFFCGIHALADDNIFQHSHFCNQCGAALQPVGTSCWMDPNVYSHYESGNGICQYTVQYADIEGKCPKDGVKWRGRCVTEYHSKPEKTVYKYTGDFIN